MKLKLVEVLVILFMVTMFFVLLWKFFQFPLPAIP